MATSTNPHGKEALRGVHNATVTHTGPDRSTHAIKLTSRCDCAWNGAHALARAAQGVGYGGIVQTWLGAWPHSVETTEYPPFGAGSSGLTDIDEDDLPF